MTESQLVPIIQRLDAMRKDEMKNVQIRRFEKDGKERCKVKYDHHTKKYVLIDHTVEKQYEFDNIDYIAVEILELIQPVTSTEPTKE